MISTSSTTLGNITSFRLACMYISLYVYVHVYIYACMHIFTYIYMYICMYVSMHVSMGAYIADFECALLSAFRQHESNLEIK